MAPPFAVIRRARAEGAGALTRLAHRSKARWGLDDGTPGDRMRPRTDGGDIPIGICRDCR
jgi:hypothetical protein